MGRFNLFHSRPIPRGLLKSDDQVLYDLFTEALKPYIRDYKLRNGSWIPIFKWEQTIEKYTKSRQHMSTAVKMSTTLADQLARSSVESESIYAPKVPRTTVPDEHYRPVMSDKDGKKLPKKLNYDLTSETQFKIPIVKPWKMIDFVTIEPTAPGEGEKDLTIPYLPENFKEIVGNWEDLQLQMISLIQKEINHLHNIKGGDEGDRVLIILLPLLVRYTAVNYTVVMMKRMLTAIELINSGAGGSTWQLSQAAWLKTINVMMGGPIKGNGKIVADDDEDSDNDSESSDSNSGSSILDDVDISKDKKPTQGDNLTEGEKVTGEEKA